MTAKTLKIYICIQLQLQLFFVRSPTSVENKAKVLHHEYVYEKVNLMSNFSCVLMTAFPKQSL